MQIHGAGIGSGNSYEVSVAGAASKRENNSGRAEREIEV